MKLLFILPYDNIYRYNGAFKRSVTYAPLTFTTLAALVPKDIDVDIEIIDEGAQKHEYDNKSYDIVGLTCVVSSAPRAYELAAYWKKRGSYIILGGAHPTSLPEEAEKHCDTLFVGFAEETFPQFLRDFTNGIPKKIYRQNVDTPLSAPIPRRDLVPKNLYVNVPTIIANRGCMNNCEFCSIPRMWGKKNFTRPIGEVIDEIKQLKSKYLLFLDPSPTSNRTYAMELYKALIPLNIKWVGLATVNISDDKELLDSMLKSGCASLLIGFESMSQESMALSRKGFNNVKIYKDTVNLLHENNIDILGTFVLGIDGDTKENLLNIPDFIDELEIDLPRFAVLTPYPGTHTFQKLKNEGRLITEDWSLYDSEKVVFRPRNMTPNELQQIFYDVYKETYSIKRVLNRSRKANHKILVGIFNFGIRSLVMNMKRHVANA